jgi:hypothetical protein
MSNVDLSTLLVWIFMNSEDVGEWSETGGETAGMMSPRVTKPYRDAIEAGDIPHEDDVEYTTYFGCFTNANELPDMNTIHLTGVDPTNVWHLTNAEMKGRERAIWAIEALKKYCPGFQTSRIRTFAQALGIRESRKIVAPYTLTEADVRNQAQFDDTIGICPEFLDGFGMMLLPTTGRYFQVPYRIMLPSSVENLLVAGRSVAADKLAFTATRQMAHCCVTGQAAGVAAAQSIKDGVTCREVSISSVQSRLEAQDVRLT